MLAKGSELRGRYKAGAMQCSSQPFQLPAHRWNPSVVQSGRYICCHQLKRFGVTGFPPPAVSYLHGESVSAKQTISMGTATELLTVMGSALARGLGLC